MKKSLYIGGSSNDNQGWRQRLTSKLSAEISIANPTAHKELNEDARKRDTKDRESSDISLYVISPKAIDPYIIAQAVDQSNKSAENTVFVVLEEDGAFDKSQKMSMSSVREIIENNDGNVFSSIEDAATFINEQVKEKATA